MLSAWSAHVGTYSHRAHASNTSHNRLRRVRQTRSGYVCVTAYSKAEDASVPDQVQEALRRAREIAEQASELANSAVLAGTASDAELRAAQANIRAAETSAEEPSQEVNPLRVAYEHCKEKSDEVLSDIARHCYEETAEAAGEKLGEGPWEG